MGWGALACSRMPGRGSKCRGCAGKTSNCGVEVLDHIMMGKPESATAMTAD